MRIPAIKEAGFMVQMKPAMDRQQTFDKVRNPAQRECTSLVADESRNEATMKQPDQNVAIPIPYEDEPQHNNNGFCGNMSHECHENQESIAELNQSRLDGEVTDQEANNVYRGKTLGGW